MKTYKQTIKKIATIGTGALMLGATMLGAAASDLSAYPEPFVKDGAFNGQIVIGDNAKAADVLGAVDIGMSLQFDMATTNVVAIEGGNKQVTKLGDSVEFGMAGDLLEIGEALSENRETLTESDLEALKTEHISTSSGSTDYKQYLRFNDDEYPVSASVVFDVNDDDKEGDYLFFEKSDTAFVYEIDFDEGLKSDVDNDTDLEDLDNEKLYILGNEYSIVKGTLDGDEVTLELVTGEMLDTLSEDETKTYTVNGVDYEIKVLVISDVQETVKLVVNGETTSSLEAGETYKLNNGVEIGIKEVISNEAGDITGDLVEFYIGANKMVITDDYTDDDYGSDVEIDDNDVDMLQGQVKGSLDSDKFTIDNIKLKLKIEGEEGSIYIPPGHGLREYLEDEAGMIHSGWDIVYEGLTDVETTEIALTPNGDESYNLEFTSVNGKEYDIPFVSNEDGFKFGTDDEALVFEEGIDITEDDYFVLGEEDFDDRMVSTVMQFDDIKVNDRELKFTDLAGGTKTVTYDEEGNAELNIGGNSYIVEVVDDESIQVDLNDYGHITNDVVGITTKGGTMISFEQVEGEEVVNVSITTDGSKFDSSHDDEVINFHVVSEGTDEVGIRNFTGVDLHEQDSDSDKEQGLTMYGANVILDDSNAAEELVIEYPTRQRSAQVFVTAGDVTNAETGEKGQYKTVSIEEIEVGAAVLASEVSNIASQNMIMVGGPCANEVARKVMGATDETCATGFTPGKAIIKLYDTGNGKVAILVAGDQAMDTRAAARVLANADAWDLTGTEMEIAYTSLSDITVKSVV